VVTPPSDPGAAAAEAEVGGYVPMVPAFAEQAARAGTPPPGTASRRTLLPPSPPPMDPRQQERVDILRQRVAEDCLRSHLVLGRSAPLSITILT
jgi:hypothetical protein